MNVFARFTPAITALSFFAGRVMGDVGFRITELPGCDCWECETCHFPRAINNSGHVCGDYRDPGTQGIPNHAFLTDPESGEFLDLGSPPGCGLYDVHAVALNDGGAVTGVASGSCPRQAWLWTRDAGMIGLGDLPGGIAESEPYDINNLNQVVGQSSAAVGSMAFLWDPAAGMISLGYIPYEQDPPESLARAINDNTWILGDTGPGSFIWTPDAGMQLLSEFTNELLSYGAALNDRGQIVGLGRIAGVNGAVLWDPGNDSILIPQFPGYPIRQLWPQFLNNLGVVVGRIFDPQNPDETRYFVWDQRRGTRLLNELIDPCWPYAGLPEITIWLTGMNNAGAIVAWPGGDATLNGLVLTPYIPGDLDEDGDCDLQDLAYQLTNFGRTEGANYAAGDLDCDQDVDLQDLSTLLANFGETLP